VLALCLMTSSTIFCQVSSNSGYPKTVTGIVDFGSETYSVFTQAQKRRMVEKVMRLDDCEANALKDSIIIEKFKQKSVTDSLALSECERANLVLQNMFDLSQDAVNIKQEEVDKANSELKKSERKAATQKILKKIGAGIGTTLGIAGGFVAGFFGAKLADKSGQ